MVTKDGNYRIINDNVLTTTEIDKESIDLIVTSPPYNLDIEYNSNDDWLAYKDYLNFTSQWLEKCFEWLKPDGRICINIPLVTNKGGPKPISSDLTQRSMDVGFQYKTTIIWNKNTVLTRTAWGSWKSASSPCIIAPVEIILILYKDQWKKISKGISTVGRDEFIEWTNGLWAFGTASKKRIGHPAPFPLELPDRCIKMFSYQDDLVLDPFAGSGTTLISAYQNGRRGIGIELDKEYYELAVNRFKQDTEQIQLF